MGRTFATERHPNRKRKRGDDPFEKFAGLTLDERATPDNLGYSTFLVNKYNKIMEGKINMMGYRPYTFANGRRVWASNLGTARKIYNLMIRYSG